MVKAEVRQRAYCLLSPVHKKKIIEKLQDFSHNSQREIIKEANLICAYTFFLFGRPVSCGNAVNWHKDYFSGYEWPRDFYGDIKIINEKDNSDIKYAWELNRFFHCLKLGQAYWFTDDQKYADRFIDLICSWIEKNPAYTGINWQCSMEVAIRAINLIWSYCFFIDCPKVTDTFHSLFYNLMYTHGNHIFHNLENKTPVKGNHYIANLVGLLFISTLFPMMNYSQKWRSFALREIIKEMENQVLPDGVDFEGSLAYHRLVTEMFFHALWLPTAILMKSDPQTQEGTYRKTGETLFPVSFVDKLEKMCEFIYLYSRPDGSAPQIGDNDSGRLLPLGSSYRDIQSHRHMLALAGEFFDRHDFKAAARGCYDEAFWIFGGDIHVSLEENYAIESKSFNSAGIFIMRQDNDFLIVRCSQPGSRGKGTHSHNDSLSFELCYNGKPFIVDPGSYSYTGYPHMRNLFRSTSYHNTVVISRREQNEMSSHLMFRLFPCSSSKTLLWHSSKNRDIFIGQISYEKINVIHRRKIIYNKKEKTWFLSDFFSGKGTYELIWSFHVSPEIKIFSANKMITLQHENGDELKVKIDYDGLIESKVIEGWYCPVYGHLEKSLIIQFSCKIEIPGEFSYCFYGN